MLYTERDTQRVEVQFYVCEWRELSLYKCARPCHLWNWGHNRSSVGGKIPFSFSKNKNAFTKDTFSKTANDKTTLPNTVFRFHVPPHSLAFCIPCSVLTLSNLQIFSSNVRLRRIDMNLGFPFTVDLCPKSISDKFLVLKPTHIYVPGCCTFVSVYVFLKLISVVAFTYSAITITYESQVRW